MIQCGTCGNDENFVQECGGFRRTLRVFTESQGFKVSKGVWKTAKDASGVTDRILCTGCKSKVMVSPKAMNVWRLNDRPASTAPTLDLDEALRVVKKCARDADL